MMKALVTTDIDDELFEHADMKGYVCPYTTSRGKVPPRR